MSIYETIIIFRTTRIDTDTLKESMDKYKDLIQSFSKPKKIKMEELGEKKLAYEIKKETSGYYVVFTWTGTPEDIAELERQLRVDDHVLKFITVKRDDEDDVELDDLPESEQDHPAKSQDIPNALDIMLGLVKLHKDIT